MRLYPIFLAAALAATTASAADLIDKSSPHDVATTMDRLETAIADSGASVMSRVNHAGIAEGGDMKLRPNEVLIFGSMKLGTPLIQQSPQVGLVMPLRISAYEDAEGDVHVIYEDIASRSEEFGGDGGGEAVTKVVNLLDKVTNEAIAE